MLGTLRKTAVSDAQVEGGACLDSELGHSGEGAAS